MKSDNKVDKTPHDTSVNTGVDLEYAMKPLQIYEELVKLKDDPEQFDQRANEIWEHFYQSLTPEQEQQARRFKWQMDAQLRNYKDPIARMNKMIELFWQGFQTFQLSLSNPSSLIARSQDGSKAVVIPINKDK